MARTEAINDYIRAIELADRAVKEIQLYIDDHGEVEPENVNWTHVSSMYRLIADLNLITDYIHPQQ